MVLLTEIQDSASQSLSSAHARQGDPSLPYLIPSRRIDNRHGREIIHWPDAETTLSGGRYVRTVLVRRAHVKTSYFDGRHVEPGKRRKG